MKNFLIFFFGFCLCLTALAVDASEVKKPQQILLDLKKEMTIVGEKYGALDAYEKKVEEARAAMHLAVAGGDESALLERDSHGMTPLMAAAFDGHAVLVEELLKAPVILKHLEDKDAKGLTALSYAVFALKQSMLICNPTLAQNAYALAQMRAVWPYYEGKKDLYEKTAALLTAAGAKSDKDTLKRQWVVLCWAEGQAMERLVTESRNLQKTILTEGERAIAAHKK